MKSMTLLAAAFAAFVSLAGATPPASGLTTNLVVYTDIHVPTNTSHYHATRLSLEIRNGLVVGCRSEGSFDLYSGQTSEEARSARAARAKGGAPRLAPLGRRARIKRDK